MVLDLTNSSRYYNFAAEVPNAEQRGIFYRKVCIIHFKDFSPLMMYSGIVILARK
jgi:hypothetical protein